MVWDPFWPQTESGSSGSGELSWAAADPAHAPGCPQPARGNLSHSPVEALTTAASEMKERSEPGEAGLVCNGGGGAALPDCPHSSPGA